MDRSEARHGWLRDAEGVAHPPAPWHLGVSGCASLWQVPGRGLPAAFGSTIPSGTRPLAVCGRALVAVAFLRYQPGGVLAYTELLAGVVLPPGPGLRLTVPQIWVDSPASRAGGRALWAIPKELAELAVSASAGAVQAEARRDGQELAALRFRTGARLPGLGRWGFTLLQQLNGDEHRTPVHLRGPLRRGRARWRFPADGPFGFLADRSPLASALLEDAAIVVGRPRRLSAGAPAAVPAVPGRRGRRRSG